MIWTKVSHQSAKFQTSDCSRKISPNLYFDSRFLLLKVYKILAQKYRRVMFHDPEGRCKIWRKTDRLFQKWQEFGEIWPEHSKVSNISTFFCSHCAKYFMFGLNKYRGAFFYDTEKWCEIWRKTDLWFAKWHKEQGKFLPEHSKVSKIFILMGSF